MQTEQLEVKRTKITNHKDVDVVIRDFYGYEHVLFPMMEKELLMVSMKGNKKCPTVIL